jgi:hypothetical protein
MFNLILKAFYVSSSDLIRQSRQFLPSVWRVTLDPRVKPEDDTLRSQNPNGRRALWRVIHPKLSWQDLFLPSRTIFQPVASALWIIGSSPMMRGFKVCVSLFTLITRLDRVIHNTLSICNNFTLDPRDKPEDDTLRSQSPNGRRALWRVINQQMSSSDLIRQSSKIHKQQGQNP